MTESTLFSLQIIKCSTCELFKKFVNPHSGKRGRCPFSIYHGRPLCLLLLSMVNMCVMTFIATFLFYNKNISCYDTFQSRTRLNQCLGNQLFMYKSLGAGLRKGEDNCLTMTRQRLVQSYFTSGFEPWGKSSNQKQWLEQHRFLEVLVENHSKCGVLKTEPLLQC